MERELAHSSPTPPLIKHGGPSRTGTGQPDEDSTELREASQQTNIKLFVVAERVLKFAQGAPLPELLLGELSRALARHTVGSHCGWDEDSADVP
jgi:hypothetical protein